MKLLLLVCALAACQRSHKETLPLEMASAQGVTFDLGATAPPADYDPITLAASSTGVTSNPEPTLPPQCYVVTGGNANPCQSCHTHSTNMVDDWDLQQNYPFKETTQKNHWRNTLRERGELVERVREPDLLGYIGRDNYTPLRRWLADRQEFPGWRLDLDLEGGFDADGFAKDGSGWRAVRYKPFVGFGPASGASDDLYIRLPDEFRRDATGAPSRDVYRANLAIVEAAIAGDPGAPLPATYTGTAAAIAVERSSYPRGTELAHTVRYLDPDRPGMLSRRVKEVRYMRKTAQLDRRQRAAAYTAAEAAGGPTYEGDPRTGYDNNVGWRLQGWIEDARGWLRLQTHEEQQACMGCHTMTGAAIDSTFSFARKLPGAAGWQVQDATGIADAPQLGKTEGEYATYFQQAATNGGLPDRAAAVAFDRAYLANVIEQSYVWGRDPITSPAPVHATIVERSTGLGERGKVVRESTLRLDWRR